MVGVNVHGTRTARAREPERCRGGSPVSCVAALVAVAVAATSWGAARANAQDVWVPSGALATAREYHTATVLADGVHVVVAGGAAEGYFALEYERTAELYDARTGAWTPVANMSVPRYQHTATRLDDGTVLVVGGYNNGTGTYEATAERFNVSTGAWTPTASALATGRYIHTATAAVVSPRGSSIVVIAGGYSNQVPGGYISAAEIYEPAPVNGFRAVGSLAEPRYYHTASAVAQPSAPTDETTEQVLVAGGFNAAGFLASAELFDPATERWTATGPLVHARFYHTQTTLLDGRVLVAGGANGTYMDTAELYDPATGTWALTGRMVAARYDHTATLLPGGAVVVIGGFGSLGYLGIAELFDPATGLWTATSPLGGAHYRHTATLLGYGYVLVAAGFDGVSFLNATQLYLPPIAQLPSPVLPTVPPPPAAEGTSPPESPPRYTTGGIVAVVLLVAAAIAIVGLTVALIRTRRGLARGAPSGTERDPLVPT